MASSSSSLPHIDGYVLIREDTAIDTSRHGEGARRWPTSLFAFLGSLLSLGGGSLGILLSLLLGRLHRRLTLRRAAAIALASLATASEMEEESDDEREKQLQLGAAGF